MSAQRKVETTEATITEVRVEPGGDWSDWATVRFQEKTGFISIRSDHGDWSYQWTRHMRGGISLAEFLGSLDIEYAGEKFIGPGLWVYSGEKTQASVRYHILESRRDGSMDRDEARSEWDLAEDLDDYEVPVFVDWVRESTIDDAYEFRRTEIDLSWRHFWERLWEPWIRPELKEIAASMVTEQDSMAAHDTRSVETRPVTLTWWRRIIRWAYVRWCWRGTGKFTPEWMIESIEEMVAVQEFEEFAEKTIVEIIARYIEDSDSGNAEIADAVRQKFGEVL